MEFLIGMADDIMKALYKITKGYRNGRDDYYVKADVEIMKDKDERNDFLERLGEATDGGHNYGYTMTPVRIKKLPKGKHLWIPCHLRRKKYKIIFWHPFEKYNMEMTKYFRNDSYAEFFAEGLRAGGCEKVKVMK